ncbi:acyl-CoA dehydrogenase family protein [Phenylobacterium aquaticum]|uniref:acyl-CoA dehydrogenase family protein n=1 Tax=Phenylobacterium aquaticum TaxID=1763816 RepID=UPI0026F1856B|nr:acyl-CoA dehydrogenase family protein [Phenylobacterium aquaticum]
MGSPLLATAKSALPPGVVEAAREAAGAVDQDGRFPTEAFAELRRHGLLGALVPKALGGLGLTFGETAAQCQALAGACGSAGMILAMHHIQVAILVRHALHQPWHAAFARRLCQDQLLLASATSEVDIGGAIRTSICAIVAQGGAFTVEKKASAISYALDADALFLTARANPDAVTGDQALVILEGAGLEMESRQSWDAMGMRGTGSGAFLIKGSGDTAQIFDTPFAEIAASSMAPVSHALWGAVWTGIATDAVLRARRALRGRTKPGVTELPTGALRLVEAVETLQLAEARVRTAIADLDWDAPGPAGFAEAAANNGLKTSVSEACLSAAQTALAICGFAGYARDGEFSVSRHVRDLHSAPLMIGNGRMREGSARLLLAQRPKLGLG